MDILLKGIMRYRANVKETMVKQFVQVKDNPEVSLVKVFIELFCRQCM